MSLAIEHKSLFHKDQMDHLRAWVRLRLDKIIFSSPQDRSVVDVRVVQQT